MKQSIGVSPQLRSTVNSNNMHEVEQQGWSLTSKHRCVHLSQVSVACFLSHPRRLWETSSNDRTKYAEVRTLIPLTWQLESMETAVNTWTLFHLLQKQTQLMTNYLENVIFFFFFMKDYIFERLFSSWLIGKNHMEWNKRKVYNVSVCL